MVLYQVHSNKLVVGCLGFNGHLSISVYIGPSPKDSRGWSGGAMVLGKLPVPGRPTILDIVGQGPTALAVGAGGDCLDIFSLIYPSLLCLPLFGRRPDID